MALQVRALDNVGVEVSGFDITKPLGAALAAELVAGAPVRPVIRPTDLQASIKASREDRGG